MCCCAPSADKSLTANAPPQSGRLMLFLLSVRTAVRRKTHGSIHESTRGLFFLSPSLRFGRKFFYILDTLEKNHLNRTRIILFPCIFIRFAYWLFSFIFAAVDWRWLRNPPSGRPPLNLCTMTPLLGLMVFFKIYCYETDYRYRRALLGNKTLRGLQCPQTPPRPRGCQRLALHWLPFLH